MLPNVFELLFYLQFQWVLLKEYFQYCSGWWASSSAFP